jgi:predicted DNA-binding ribbon-helix-helix protein
MPEMMGIVLLADMLAKDGRKRHEFQELINRNRLSSRMSSALRLLCLRWVR